VPNDRAACDPQRESTVWEHGYVTPGIDELQSVREQSVSNPEVLARLTTEFDGDVVAEAEHFITEMERIGATALAEIRDQLGDHAIRVARATPLGLLVLIATDRSEQGTYVSGELRPWTSVNMTVDYFWQRPDSGWQVRVTPGFGYRPHDESVIVAGDADHVRQFVQACLEAAARQPRGVTPGSRRRSRWPS
jgi:hypothetical protein